MAYIDYYQVLGVDKTASQNLIIRSSTFSLGETTGKTAECRKFFFVLYL